MARSANNLTVYEFTYRGRGIGIVVAAVNEVEGKTRLKNSSLMSPGAKIMAWDSGMSKALIRKYRLKRGIVSQIAPV